jgi:hypothetical protein
MSDHEKPKQDRRPINYCDHCGLRARLNPIPAAYAADVALRLCDDCTAKRQQALEQMYRGE